MKTEKLTTLLDDALIALVLDGNTKAWDVLINRYSDKLHAIICKKIRQSDDAKDLYQDAVIKAYGLIVNGNYSHQGKFPNWISIITSNMIIDFLRKQTTRKKMLVSNPEMVMTFKISDTDYDPQDPRLIAEEKLIVAIEMLPVEQQKTIQDFYFNDLFANEIAANDSVPLNTVLSRLSYARIKLRKLLD